ncbi:helix-turn-helix domain-containing protein [Aestuariibaculum lutulentum]|uniref:HTH cro/C1-type domain-containing protein n=1 Tax=Aestuariibaculum lutulentum TaxID=2920935 RepID=A0ABS9RFP7_9FLAO|nr:hypothetical protein [Aestuariibaculum lutulentum]MCH4551773.1 hypothetical protein [Aestuariibaculum lutulentum]
MKKYNSIGELFTDYREFYNLSQSDFASELNVDLRTVQRWEKDLTLIKSEKEEDIVLNTLMPYQLIHNLNAAVPIPTFYDFKTRKYSLSAQTNDLPKLEWYLDQINVVSNNLRTIDFDFDIKYLEHFIDSQKKDDTFLNHELIKEAIRLLPELNFVFTGKSGYYAGHSIVLPLKKETYLKLKNKEINVKQLRSNDLTNYKNLEQPIFFRYDITGDCNDSLFYVMAQFFRFFKNIENKNYIMSSYTERDDTYDLNLQIGFNILWEDKELQNELNLDHPPRFMEGSFEEFFSKLE